MSNRDSYTATDWQTLQFAPLWVFTAVAAADKQVDKKEVEALATSIASAPFFKEPLVNEVLTSVAVGFSTIFDDYNKDKRDVLQGLRDVASVLARNATSDQSANFKRAMLMIGTDVAKASGGTLFHRDPVSNEEKAALVMVAMALDVKL
jgi:hypothetical protein